MTMFPSDGRVLATLFLVVSAASCHSSDLTKPIKTERGWKTERVTAEPWHAAIGWSAVFRFPKNPGDCDRAEIGEFVEAHSGNAFEMGGSPGAPMYVLFDDASTKEGVDRKIQEVLPGLEKVMDDITAGRPVKIAKVKKRILDGDGKEWPECVPPNRKNADGGMFVNSTPYRCSSAGKWVVDQKALQIEHEYEVAKWRLMGALTTRKLTHDELMRLSPEANVPDGTPFYPCEQLADLYDSLAKQWELQTGKELPVYTPLSKQLGEYGRCPQEQDNRRAVEKLIGILQTMPGAPTRGQ